jgi:REP element-mobilizing transposase RayT
MALNDAGSIANLCWLNIPNHFPNVVLHEHIIMPNHVHGIIELVGANNHSPNIHSPNNHSPDNHSPNNHSPNNHSPVNHSPVNHSHEIRAKIVSHDNGAKIVSPLRSPSKTIGSIVRGYKIGVTKWFRSNENMENMWQRNYWEHIIRDEQSYHRIVKYIINNPKNWKNGK